MASPPPPPPPPYTWSSSSLSRTWTDRGSMRATADDMLRSSIQEDVNGPRPTNAGAANAPPRPPLLPIPSSSTTTSRTRERLRQVEAELATLRSGRPGTGADRTLTADDRTLTAADRRSRIDQLKRDARAMGNVPRKSTENLFKMACSTDVLFLMDTTASMGGYINEAKKQVTSIMDEISEILLGQVEVRIAIVGYKDHGDKPNIEFLDFTTDSNAARRFLERLRATGGADEPEDVLGGLQTAIRASWKHQARSIIHIADAPPHGRTLHDLTGGADTYADPGSEPHGLTHPALLEAMIKKELNYALLRINSSTDRMIFTFAEAYHAASADCRLLPDNKYELRMRQIITDARRERQSSGSTAGALRLAEYNLGTSYSELRRVIVASVTNSCSSTAIRTIASFSKDMHKKASTPRPSSYRSPLVDNHLDLETGDPQWHVPRWFNHAGEFEGYAPDIVVHSAKTLNDMMADDKHIRLDVMQLTVLRRLRPFAEGAVRRAFYARTARSTNRFVVKTFKKDEKHMPHLAEDMRGQALCKAFALEFNSMVDGYHSIDFVVTTCLQARMGATGGVSDECVSLEPFIPGEYVKYNGNNGYVNTELAGDPTCQAAQAFSHFTFERSYGHFLICDLQGVGRIMTDPAIHAKDPDRFPLTDTNLGAEGFKFFFVTHECNDICRKLKLKSSRHGLVAGAPASALQFRELWPAMESTVCCFNKLCRKIVSVESAHKSDDFPGCHWCDTCWPQLRDTTIKWICAAPGPRHEFDVSRFYFESQGRNVPTRCPEDREVDATESRAAVVGGNLFSRLAAITTKKSVSGRDW